MFWSNVLWSVYKNTCDFLEKYYEVFLENPNTCRELFWNIFFLTHSKTECFRVIKFLSRSIPYLSHSISLPHPFPFPLGYIYFLHFYETYEKINSRVYIWTFQSSWSNHSKTHINRKYLLKTLQYILSFYLWHLSTALTNIYYI